jgi:hypothetical protein
MRYDVLHNMKPGVNSPGIKVFLLYDIDADGNQI